MLAVSILSVEVSAKGLWAEHQHAKSNSAQHVEILGKTRWEKVRWLQMQDKAK